MKAKTTTSRQTHRRRNGKIVNKSKTWYQHIPANNIKNQKARTITHRTHYKGNSISELDDLIAQNERELEFLKHK